MIRADRVDAWCIVGAADRMPLPTRRSIEVLWRVIVLVSDIGRCYFEQRD